MLQRKQTVFLFISFLLTIVCLCLPIGSFEPNEMGVGKQMFNLWLLNDGHHEYSVAGLFFILLITCPISLKAISSFHNRMFQSRLCVLNIILLVLWYVVYVVSVKIISSDMYSFNPSIAACFPLISIILLFMARKGILDDEKLVRAADRIR